MAQETLEQTQRRLGLSTAPVTHGRTMRQHSPMPTPSAPPPVNARGAFRIAVAIGVMAAIGVVGYTVFQTPPQTAIDDDQWTDYPGTYFETDEQVLANDSLETTQQNGDDLIAELQNELADYGFEWSTEYPSDAYHPDNGYHGQSMLYNYSSASLIGAAQVSDPEARQNIIRIFSELLSARGDSTIVIENDTAQGIDAQQRFGSELRDTQAIWSAWSQYEHLTELSGNISVFDATVPTADEFDGDYWVPDDATGTLFVRLSVGAYFLLSDDDREAFIAALQPYEGQTKPGYGG